MLIHICCSIDSHFFLQKLREKYPHEKLIGFFYNPNIHPFSEYYLRLLDVKRSCEMLDIELIEGEYDYVSWLDFVKGFEEEPEKGERCVLCFDKRVEESMKKALEIGEKKVTTTLLASPKKSIKQLKEVGEKLASFYNLQFVCHDFRINGGTQEQFALARENKLYHQDYCGCLYALDKQRKIQNRVSNELFCSINKQILPNSLEERIALYEKRYKAEKNKQKYEIVKDKILNYRLLRAYIKVQQNTIPSYFLSFSYIKRKKAKLKIEKYFNAVAFSNRENVKIIELSYLNQILKKKYQNIKELYFSPISFEDEIKLRQTIENTFYTISPVVIVDKIDFKNFEIFCDANLYQDIRENLVIF